MTLEEKIFQALNAVAPTYPIIAPADAPSPRITYLRIAGKDHETLADGGGAPRVRVQVDVWALQFAQSRDLAAAARAALRAALTIGEITDNPDEYEPDTKLFRASFDIAAWD